MFEEIVVLVARLVALVDFFVLMYRGFTVEAKSISTAHLVAEVAVFFVALAIIIRANICEEEREATKKRNKAYRKARR